MSVVTAGARTESELWQLAVIAAVTVIVFWLAHVYAQGLEQSLALGRRLNAADIWVIARRESSIALAGILPVAMIVLGAAGVLSDSAALWLAVGVGVAALTVQGMRYARLERLSRTGTLLTVATNVGLGLVLVVLKALLAH
jgi:hypothetical protein